MDDHAQHAHHGGRGADFASRSDVLKDPVFGTEVINPSRNSTNR